MHELVLFVLGFAICANAAKILIVFPVYSHSHHTLGYSLANELANSGHDITFASPVLAKKTVTNLKNVELVGLKNATIEKIKSVNMFQYGTMPPFVSTIFTGKTGLMIAEETLKDEAMQKLLKSDETFDLVITEAFVCDAIQGLASYYNAPSVVVSPIGANMWSNHLVGAFHHLCHTCICIFQRIPYLSGEEFIIPSSHPNMKLFITHGGLLSTIETIYHGVPVIGIPIFGDQSMNIATAVNAGYGLELPFKELTETTFSEKVHEALTNPKYSRIAKHRSMLMHDQQVKPRDKAVYWVNYILRHKGAPHLKSAGIQLNAYEYYLVDVMIFLALSTIVIFATVYRTAKWILCRNNQTTKRKIKQS